MEVTWRRRLMWSCVSISALYVVVGIVELQLQCDLGFEYPGYSIVCPGWKDGWPSVDGIPGYKIKEPFGYVMTFVPPMLLMLTGWAVGWPLRAAAATLAKVFRPKH
jgi:hypothetical protein